MADKYRTLQGGREKMVEATVVSTGVSEAGDIVALGSNGKLDESVLPAGIGADVKVLLATENLTAGKYVNIYDDAGTPKCRLADSTNDRPAHGYVKDAVTSGNNATIYFEGANDDLSGIVGGTRYYLGAAGAATATVPSTPTDVIIQLLGVGIDSTSVNTDIEDAILL
jgi:hypothetical protein